MDRSRLITRDLDTQFNSLRKHGVTRDLPETSYYPVEVKKLPKLSAKTSLVPNYGFKKNAVVGGYGDVKTTDPQIRNPLLNVINFYLPERREILNQWIRYYDRFDPLVGNCIDLHAMVPFSRFSFSGIDDKRILQFYEDMATDMHMLKRIFEISREYELIGEVFPFCHWSHEKNCFDDMIILNPDFVNVRGVQQAGKDNYTLELIPDPEMRAMINSQNVEDLLLVSKLDPELVYAVQNNMNIQLDAFNVEPVMRKQNPYDQRGTAITLRCLKDLMYKDKLREAQVAVAEGKITPYQIWKLGDPANGYLPSSEDLEDFRALLQAGKGDMDYNIITHHGLEVEFVGLNGKLLPIIPEMEFINKQIMVALFTNESFVMGNGPNFSTASVAMRVYQARYESKRDLILDYLMRKIFMPVAMANEFYQRSQADLAHNVRTKNDQRRLIIPEFRWEGKVNLVDDPQKIQFLIQLRQMGLPLDPIMDMMGLDKEQILKQIDAEERTKLSMSQVMKRQQPPNPFGGMFGGSPVGGGLGGAPQAGVPRPGGVPPVGSMPVGSGNPKNEQAAENKQFHKEQIKEETLADLIGEKKK